MKSLGLVANGAALALLLAAPTLSADIVAGPHDAAAVRAWLRDRLHSLAPSADDQPVRYNLAWADLNGDGRPEAIVYLFGGGWCGSGGCQMYVLQTQGQGFRLRATTTITRLPIYVLNTHTNGWRDVSVNVAGGGITRGYQARLQFDGWKYLSNPSMAYALRGKPPWRAVIGRDDASRPVFGAPE